MLTFCIHVHNQKILQFVVLPYTSILSNLCTSPYFSQHSSIRYKNNTDHSLASRGPLPSLLSIIRTGNEACGRVSKQFFPQWKQGAAIFWAVWVTHSCSGVCLCVSCCFHSEACAVCQRPTQGHVPLCGIVPLWFSVPNHVFMVYSEAIFTLSLTEATQETWTDHTKTKRGGQYRERF